MAWWVVDPEASDSQILVRDVTRRFLESASPLALRKQGTDVSGSGLRSFWKEAAGVGITSLLVPEPLGGPGLDDAVGCLAVVAEEVGRLVAPGPLVPTSVVADTLARTGTQAQQAAWLPGIAEGEIIASWALGEQPDTWTPSAGRCRATTAAGGYRLDGVKSPVEAAVDADVLLVTAAGTGGLVQLLVPTDAPGVLVTPLATLDLAHSFAEVTFDGVEVPGTDEVGDAGTAAADVERQIDLACCVQVAETAAIMQMVFEQTIEYLGDRHAFGRVLTSYQAIKHRLAEHKIWLEASLGMATAVARAVDEADAARSRLASAAKADVAEQSLTTISDCSQLLGGISMTWEHDHHVFFRRATVNRALYGSPTFHRERLCRLAGV